MSRLRHWKEITRWDPNADLFYRKKLRMGENGFVLPGEKVTQATREKLGLHRLKTWFLSGTLSHSADGGRGARNNYRTPAPQVEMEYPMIQQKGKWFTSRSTARRSSTRSSLSTRS